jgi:hypothetical protein
VGREHVREGVTGDAREAGIPRTEKVRDRGSGAGGAGDSLAVAGEVD